MTPFVSTVTILMSIGIVVMQLITVALLFANSRVRQFVSKHIIALGFVITLAAALGSMFYSVIAGFAPCNLCWWQRVFLFPQVFVFGTALFYKRSALVWKPHIVPVALVLSVVGALIALYHYIGGFMPSLLSACGANAVSCAKSYFTSFGYINIPMMSLTTFALIIVLLITSRRS